eukprot:c18967_g1_i1 orf=323-1369(-)
MPNSDNEHEGGRPAWMVTRREVMVSLAGLSIVVLTLIMGRVSSSSVVLITPSNETVPFLDVEASFGRKVPTSGILGVVFAAQPSNACVPLQAYIANQTVLPAFILIERGDCDFVTKVQFAQDAGYTAAIVYNNEMSFDLVTMSGSGSGIEIPAVFVSKEAGDILFQYVGNINARLYLLPALENTAWSVMAVSFISLLAVSAVLSTFFFVRRQRLRRNGSQHLLNESSALTKSELKAFPVSVFSKTVNVDLETCAICLEEYINGDKLRVLSCSHEFHMACIDQWLTTRRPFCPICKRDARSKDAKPVPSESTPLLTSARHSATSNTSSASMPSGTSTTVSINEPPGDMC